MDKFSDFSLDLNQSETIDEQNVNAIWVELDKGLFSDNIGAQCEAIVKFTDLFDRFPLPVFVNNGFLKLAKIFQNGSNYLKLHVIRVIEKNEKHLDKILSVNELTKLIFFNIHSNDSLSRALTLHALAAFSPIIAEKQNVHHSIRIALESHDDIEAKEAIYAAIKFTSISKVFADSVCDHISIMLEDITTPLERKIKLLPILVNMHHDTQISLKANRVCRWMYDSFPRTDIRTIVLNILTKISCKSFTNINETLTFFIQLLHEELREKLNLVLLNNLHIMAQNASHLWTQDNVKSFLSYLNDSLNEEIVSKCLKILGVLAANLNTSLYLEFCNDPQKLTDILSQKAKFANIHVSFEMCVFSTKLFALILKNSNDTFDTLLNKNMAYFDFIKTELYSIILKCFQDDNNGNLLNYLKTSLQCAIELAELNQKEYYQELFLFLVTPLSKLDKNAVEFCNAFSGLLIIGTKHIDFLASNETTLIEIFKKSIENSSNQKLQYDLLGLCLQLNALTTRNQNELAQSIELFLARNKNYWMYFKLARLCIKYSFYDHSKNILHLILKNVSLDTNFKHYIEFFQLISHAESNLVNRDNKKFNDLISKLNEALSMYIKAQILLKSIDTNNRNNSQFQLKYCELRSEQIKLYIHLLMATMSYHTNPAPKFLYSSSDSISKYGRIASQLKYSLFEIQKLTQKYKNLMRECFDADENSTNILSVCKKHDEFLIFLINLLSCPAKSEYILMEEFEAIQLNDLKEKTNNIELQISNRFYLNILEKMKSLSKIDKESSMTNSIQCFQRILTDLIQFRLPLPRGFFQALQKTQIKLIVGTSIKKINNIIPIKHDQTLVLKIDGIIKQLFKDRPIRTISKIQINLFTEIDQNSVKDKLIPKYTNMQSCIEEPKNDYFNSQFLINFPFVGVSYILTIDVQIIDNQGTQWSYNAAKQVHYVKVEEDPLARLYVKQVNDIGVEIMDS